jgi:CRP/FNR family cyclic AMP-dependent transcriptional regulator
MQTLEPSHGLGGLIVKHPFLAGLNPRFYRFFVECARLENYATGREIFHEGAKADHFYLIQKGRVRLDMFVPGCGRFPIETLEAGQSLGWSWLFEPHQWHLTACALQPTEIIVFDARNLLEKAEENRDFKNDLVIRVVKSLVARLHATRVRLIDRCSGIL